MFLFGAVLISPIYVWLYQTVSVLQECQSQWIFLLLSSTALGCSNAVFGVVLNGKVMHFCLDLLNVHVIISNSINE